MQFFSYLSGGRVRFARRVGALAVDLTLAGCPVTSLVDLCADPTYLRTVRHATGRVLTRPAEARRDPPGLVFDFDAADLLPPISSPGKVICAAGNYPSSLPPEAPPHPTIFLKPSSGVTAHRRPVLLPAQASAAAYEVELALVIGRMARAVSPAQALEYLAGYSIGNDIGDRLLEKRTSQWTSGKMFDTFTPFGPVLVTPDELGSPDNLELVTRLNGQVVQRGNTAQMFFNPARLVSILSELTTLCPGDVILTGSPKLLDGRSQPVLSLRPGDVVEAEIEKIGVLVNPVIAE